MNKILALICVFLFVGKIASAEEVSPRYKTTKDVANYDKTKINYDFLSNLSIEQVRGMSDIDLFQTWLGIRDLTWQQRKSIRDLKLKNNNRYQGYNEVFRNLGTVSITDRRGTRVIPTDAHVRRAKVLSEMDQVLDRHVLPLLQNHSLDQHEVYEFFENLMVVDQDLAESVVDLMNTMGELTDYKGRHRDQITMLKKLMKLAKDAKPRQIKSAQFEAKVTTILYARLPNPFRMAMMSRMKEPSYQRKLGKARYAHVARNMTPAHIEAYRNKKPLRKR